MQNEMLELFSDAFTGGTGQFAWRFDDSKTGLDRFRPAPLANIYEEDPGYSLPRIASATSYTLQWYGIVLPIARFDSNDDYTADFLNYSRICIDGFVDCQSFALSPGGEVEYIDPLTGYRYMSAASDRPLRAIAPKVLQAADEFKWRVYQPALDAHNATPADPDKKAALKDAEREIIRRAAVLDVAREVGGVFGGAWR